MVQIIVFTCCVHLHMKLHENLSENVLYSITISQSVTKKGKKKKTSRSENLSQFYLDLLYSFHRGSGGAELREGEPVNGSSPVQLPKPTSECLCER